MIAVDPNKFPKCSAYLAAVDRRAAADPAMTSFHAAIIIADALPRRQLEGAGFVWPDGSRDGDAILEALESALKRRQAPEYAPAHILESVKAFVGARGVRASRLKSDEDFWLAATTMWPRECRDGKGMIALHRILSGMTKKQRQSADVEALRASRPEWFGSAA